MQLTWQLPSYFSVYSRSSADTSGMVTRKNSCYKNRVYFLKVRSYCWLRMLHCLKFFENQAVYRLWSVLGNCQCSCSRYTLFYRVALQRIIILLLLTLLPLVSCFRWKFLLVGLHVVSLLLEKSPYDCTGVREHTWHLFSEGEDTALRE